MISDRIGALEVICQLRLLKLLVFLLLVHLAGNGLIPHILLYVVLLVHELDEVGRVHIWLQLLKHLLQLRIVLILSLILVDPHLSLHLVVVVGHEISHLVHHLVLLLGLDRLLVVLQLAGEEICLRILERYGLLLGLGLVSKAGDLVEVLASAVLNFVGVDEPNVILIIPDKLSMHLQDLNLTDFLKVVADFEALNVTILLELALLQKFIFVLQLEMQFIVPIKLKRWLMVGIKLHILVVNLFRCVLVI